VSETPRVDPVTEEFVAMARPDVAQIEVDGEIVLYDDRSKVMHRLSPTAGQVWRCLDGSGRLAEIAADIAEVYQADPAQVLDEVVATVRNLASAGLLVGVGDETDGNDVLDPNFPLGDAGSLTVRVVP
jgi:DNA/RNA-binding domain of Phe-tRNA-synthetase-like protein